MTTDDELDALERIARAATPGKRRINRYDEERGAIQHQIQAEDGSILGGTCEYDYDRKKMHRAKHDAALMAAMSPEVVLEMIARVRAAEKTAADERHECALIAGRAQADVNRVAAMHGLAFAAGYRAAAVEIQGRIHERDEEGR